MIRFFRSIRQGLINQGKTSKYLRYPVGEILDMSDAELAKR